MTLGGSAWDCVSEAVGALKSGRKAGVGAANALLTDAVLESLPTKLIFDGAHQKLPLSEEL